MRKSFSLAVCGVLLLCSSISFEAFGQIVLPGTGVDAPAAPPTTASVFGPRKSPAPITWPGAGVGASIASEATRPPLIVYPGTGVSAHVSGAGPSEIVLPGTGVGGSPIGGIYLRGAPAVPDIVYPGSGVSLVLPNNGPGQIVVPGTGVPGTAVGDILRSARQTLDDYPGITTYAVPQISGAPANPDPDLAVGVSPMNFLDLDSGLRDCDVPFDQLTKKSPFCPVGADLKDGRRCQRFSFSQFPEVVRLIVRGTDNSREICTGTMITSDWLLTAAHCFVGESATADYTESADKDFIWTAGKANELFNGATIYANNSKLANPKYRSAKRVVVFGKYSGRNSEPQFNDDIALVQLDAPFPEAAVQPAALASEKDFSPETTIAGYGYTNVNGASLGDFQLTWPAKLDKASGQFSFVPGDGGDPKSGFCQGDSGGPVFAGRFRGCKPYDIVSERRPRPLQGTISYNFLGKADAGGTTPGQRASSQCINAAKMVMLDITTAARRKWICRVAANAPLGCK